MNRVKRVSIEILEKHGDRFTSDFNKNKLILMELVIITSKNLRNKIAGYITNLKTQSDSTNEDEVTETIA